MDVKWAGGGSRLSGLAAWLLLLAVLLPLSAPAHAAPATFGSYVALGDSFTAGPLIPVTDPASAGCQRSSSNYPRALAARYQVVNFKDASCSGAATTHMFNPQTVAGGVNTPQLDSLEPSSELVTLQIGGNDIGFAEIVTSCAALLPLGTPCQDRFVRNGVDELRTRIANTAPAVDRVLDVIRARSPNARIYLVGYPSLLPEMSPGCWPFMPITPDDVGYLIGVEKDLNQMLSDVARQNGVTFVDTYGPSLLHDACQLPTVRWVEPAVGFAMGAPVHPNAAGMAATAEQVATEVARSP